MNILEDNFLELFMGTLKKNIQHEVCLLELKFIEHAFSSTMKVESKNMTTRKLSVIAIKKFMLSFLIDKVDSSTNM